MSYAYGAYGYNPYGAYGALSPYDVNALGLVQAYRALGTNGVKAVENNAPKVVSTSISSIKENVDALHKTCQGCPPDYKSKFESVERQLADISKQLGEFANAGSNIPIDLVAEITSITDHLSEMVASRHVEQSIDQKSFATRVEIANTQLSARIDTVDKSLFKVSERIDTVDKSLSKVSERIDIVDNTVDQSLSGVSERIDTVDQSLSKVENLLLENTRVLQIIRDKLDVGIPIHSDLQTLQDIPRPHVVPDDTESASASASESTVKQLNLITKTLQNLDKMSRIQMIPVVSIHVIRNEPIKFVEWLVRNAIVKNDEMAQDYIAEIDSKIEEDKSILDDKQDYKGRIGLGDDSLYRCWILQMVTLLMCSTYDMSIEGDLPDHPMDPVVVRKYQSTVDFAINTAFNMLQEINIQYSRMTQSDMLKIKALYIVKISTSEPFDIMTQEWVSHRDFRRHFDNPIYESDKLADKSKIGRGKNVIKKATGGWLF